MQDLILGDLKQKERLQYDKWCCGRVIVNEEKLYLRELNICKSEAVIRSIVELAKAERNVIICHAVKVERNDA